MKHIDLRTLTRGQPNTVVLAILKAYPAKVVLPSYQVGRADTRGPGVHDPCRGHADDTPASNAFHDVASLSNLMKSVYKAFIASTNLRLLLH